MTYEISTDEQAKISKKTNDSIFYGVTLPDSVREIGLDELQFNAALRNDKFDGETYEYFRLTEVGAATDLSAFEKSKDYEIWEKEGDPFVRFPIHLTRDRNEGLLHDVSKKDTFCVELNEEKRSIRIYKKENLGTRIRQLASNGHSPSLKGSIVGLSSLFSSELEYTDVASSTPYQGQKFKIVPFEAGYEEFEGEKPSRDTVKELIEAGNVPVTQVYRLTVKWDPKGQHEHNETVDYNFNSKRARTIYTEYFTDSARVILPSRGTFKITGTKGEEYNNWIAFYTGGNIIENEDPFYEWDTPYQEYNPDEGCLVVYTPV